MKPYYSEAGIEIYHGDCRDVLPQVPPADLVLTDPPYGGFDRWTGGWKSGNCGRGKLWNERQEWDVTPSSETFRLILDAAPSAIIWGGNFFDSLPAGRGWLIWDKMAETTQGHAELAWTNLDIPIRIWRKSPLGVFGNGGANGEVKFHPTQKPLALFQWCLSLVRGCRAVVDPYMGVGTALVAAKEAGVRAIGIDLREDYCEIAAKRLAQGVLFGAGGAA